MKAIRWAYYSAMALCLISGLYSGLRIYYYIFFTQLFAVIATTALNLWTFYSFTYRQELSRGVCVKGDDNTLSLSIINERPVPLSLIEAHVSVVSLREDVNLTFSLAPYAGHSFTIPLAVPYRGRYSVGMTRLKITDIFGLVTLSFDMRRLFFYRMAELTVLPRAQLPGTVAQNVSDTKLFSAAFKHAEQGESVSGARLYRSGDSQRRINWKKSAQMGQLYVRQYEFLERETVMLLIDTGLHGLTGEDALVYADTVCECAACIALYSLTKNRAVSLVCGSESARRFETAAVFESLRHDLARAPFGESPGVEAMLAQCRAGAAQSLFVLTRELTAALADALTHTAVPVTVVQVGGQARGGSAHTVCVEPGGDAAASLSGL